MYGICTYIYHKFMPNVGKYSMHGASGYMYMHIYKLYIHGAGRKEKHLM